MTAIFKNAVFRDFLSKNEMVMGAISPSKVPKSNKKLSFDENVYAINDPTSTSLCHLQKS